MPISLIAFVGGPTNTLPSFSHKSANSVFSDRKPYPGWIAYRCNGAIKLMSGKYLHFE